MRRALSSMALAVAALGGTEALAQVDVTLPSLDKSDGSPVMLTGQWFAAKTSANAPAVVLLHGCGGAYDARGQLSERMRDYAALLNGVGVHTLVVDSLNPRGQKQICTQKFGTRSITQAKRRLDALGALQWLATQPQVMFVGQTVAGPGTFMFQTLRDCPKDRTLEMPINEPTRKLILAALAAGTEPIDAEGFAHS